MHIEATELRGGPYERGRAHGERLRQFVHGHLAAWLDSLAQAGLGEPHAYVREMLQETDFRAAISVHAPDLLEEVDGIADGAEVPRDLIFALQLLDEEWAYRQRRRGNSSRLEKCSSLAIVSSGGPTWIGQNMDLGGYTDGWQMLMRIVRDGATPGALVFSTAGMIGLMGANASGLGVCVNSLPQLPSTSEGMPVAFVLRRLMRCRNLSEAAALVLSIPHATNQHYVIAEAGGARSFEACAAGVTEFHPADPTRLLHTNHPLTEMLGEPEPLASRENTVARLLSLQERLGKGDTGLAEVQNALSAFDDARHPVCRLKSPDSGLISFTTGSMISALRPGRAQAESWVSRGPPSLGGYSAFTLARDPIDGE